MDPAVLRARLKARRARQAGNRAPGNTTAGPASPDAIAAPVRSHDGLDLADRPLVSAAVLVPIILGPTSGVLLTKRNAHLKQSCRPGKLPRRPHRRADASPEAAALREAKEEIALDPARVELSGRLPEYVTGTGYRITPVLGLLPPGLAADARRRTRSRRCSSCRWRFCSIPTLRSAVAPIFRGRWREFWVWPHPDHYIWGATAAILVHLASILRDTD